MPNFEKPILNQPLQEKIPENLKQEWREIPKNYCSIYHFTKPEALAGIAEKGIQHYKKIFPEGELDYYQQVKVVIDKMFDEVATELEINHKRTGSVYASPDFKSINKMGKGDILLELKVDPEKYIVSDGRLITAAANSWLRTPDGQKWLSDHPEFLTSDEDKRQFDKLQQEFQGNHLDYIKKYWQNAVTLDDYNNLGGEEREKLFRMPEVIIEGDVDSKFVRLKEI